MNEAQRLSEIYYQPNKRYGVRIQVNGSIYMLCPLDEFNGFIIYEKTWQVKKMYDQIFKINWNKECVLFDHELMGDK